MDMVSLNANAVLQAMEYGSAKLKIMLLDACRDNPFEESKGRRGGLAQMKAPFGTIIGLATQPDSTATQGPIGGNSPYAEAIAKFLQVRGLGIFPFLNEVGLSVMQATHGEQRPWIAASPISGQAYLNPPANIAQAETAPPIVFRTDPSNPQLASNGASLPYIQLAYQQLDREQFPAARRTLRQAIEADRASALPYSYLGFSFYLEGKKQRDTKTALDMYREAFVHLDRAIEADGEYAPAFRHRGNTILATYRALRALRRPVNDILDKAVEDFKAAMDIDPDSKTNANALGRVLLLKGNYQEALARFRRAIEIDPTYAAPYAGSCIAYRLLGNMSSARTYAKEAAKRDDALEARQCLTQDVLAFM